MMDPNKQGVSHICRNVDCNSTSSLSRGPSPSNLRTSRKRRSFGKRKEHERGIDKEPTLYPVELDVTCGRGKHRWNSKGNRRYRAIIMQNIIRYQEARTKCGKSSIVREVVQQVQENMAKFVKRDPKTKLWKALTPTETRTKVAHALRDHIRIVSCSSMGASNANLRESESIESASHEGDEERESHHMKGLSLPNHMNNNVTTEQLSSSAHDEMPPWAARPSNCSVVLRAASLDIKACHHKEQRKEGPAAGVIVAPSWQPARVSFEKHLEDDHEFSVAGSYLDLPNGLHQQPCQSQLCDNSQQQDHRKNDGMSGVTQLSGFTPLKHAISPWVRCTLHSGGVSNPNTGGGYFQVGNNQNVHSFGVCSCRNIPGAITMAMASSDERNAPTGSTFPQPELDTFVSPSLSTNGPACGQQSIAIGSRHQANDAMSIISSVANLPMHHMEGHPVAKPKMVAIAKNFSVSSQLIGGSPMPLTGSHNVSRATGAFDLVVHGLFPWLQNYVNEANTPSVGGQLVNEDDHDISTTFQSRFAGPILPTINHNLGAQLLPPLPLGILNSLSSFPGLCDDVDDDIDDSFNCGEREVG